MATSESFFFTGDGGGVGGWRGESGFFKKTCKQRVREFSEKVLSRLSHLSFFFFTLLDRKTLFTFPHVYSPAHIRCIVYVVMPQMFVYSYAYAELVNCMNTINMFGSIEQ